MIYRAIAFLFFISYLLAAPAHPARAEEIVDEGTYADVTSCKNCHEARYKTFACGIHGTTGFTDPEYLGCESCHGPGAAHASSGDKLKIIGPSTWTQEYVDGVCLVRCHIKTPRLKYWEGSPHQRAGLMCYNCHKVSFSRFENDKLVFKGQTMAEACLKCHSEIRIALSQRSHHPLRDSTRPDLEGNMVCSDCHNPHGSVADHLIDANSINDKCWQCHMEKKAPVLWEHPPVKENCLNCHTPHGSNNPSLLRQNVTFLCLSCHPQGNMGTGHGISSIGRGCVNCHPTIHGSNNPSGATLNQ
ncbi:MAG: DmsE family decaheme c-type cytochrome [Nitrospirota bacterium]